MRIRSISLVGIAVKFSPRDFPLSFVASGFCKDAACWIGSHWARPERKTQPVFNQSRQENRDEDATGSLLGTREAAHGERWQGTQARKSEPSLAKRRE